MNIEICKGETCNAEIVWGTTKNDKPIPLNAKPEKRFVFLPGAPAGQVDMVDTYMPHHATCPDVGMFRRQSG